MNKYVVVIIACVSIIVFSLLIGLLIKQDEKLIKVTYNTNDTYDPTDFDDIVLGTLHDYSIGVQTAVINCLRQYTSDVSNIEYVAETPEYFEYSYLSTKLRVYVTYLPSEDGEDVTCELKVVDD